MLTLRRLSPGLLAAALLASAPPARAAEADPLLPDDSEMVVTLSFRQMLDSALVKKYGTGPLKLLLQQDEVQQHLKDLGFDPLTDLESFTMAGPGGDNQNGLAILRGKFDPTRFKAKADDAVKEHGHVIKAVKASDGSGGEYQLYELTIENSPTPVFVAVADKSAIVAAATKEYVVDALQKAAGKKKPALKSKALPGLLSRVDPKASVVMVSTDAGLAGAPAGDIKEVLDKVQNVSGGVTITDGIRTEFLFEAKSADGARDLESKVKEGLDKAKELIGIFAAGNRAVEPVVKVLEQVKTDVKDKKVTVESRVTAEAIEKAIGDAR